MVGPFQPARGQPVRIPGAAAAVRFRLAAGVYVLALLGTLFLAGFHRELELSLRAIWSIVVIAPVVIAGGAFALARATYKDPHFDPTSEDSPSVTSPGVETYGEAGSGIEPGDYLNVDGYWPRPAWSRPCAGPSRSPTLTAWMPPNGKRRWSGSTGCGSGLAGETHQRDGPPGD